MKISNIRFGFATNSSSTHSIILNKTLKDDYDGQEFGWGDFTLASKESKQLYLAQTFFHSISQEIGDELASQVIKGLFNLDIDTEGYIDHQSQMKLPLSPKTKRASVEFFKELTDYYLQDKFTIIGWNDNDDNCRYKNIRQDFILPTDTSDTLFSRKDGDWWVLMNTRTGLKIRLSFKDNPEPYTKASSPELVDLKITNMCLNNCSFCYQDSTPNGKHAERDNINRIIWGLRDIGVFEVALGGGEPTLYPYFIELLDDFSWNGILCNFTTRDLKWTHNDLIVDSVQKNVSRFGISVSSTWEMEQALESIPKSLHDKIYWHYVLNTGSLESILKDTHGKSLIILGFKKSGRGSSYHIWKQEDNWVDLVKNHYGVIGIDTKLATDYKEKLKDVDQKLITYDEGKFSCYIDVVDMKMGNCSYTDKYIMLPKDVQGKDLLKIFKTY